MDAEDTIEQAARALYYAEMSEKFKKVPDWESPLMRVVRKKNIAQMRRALAAAGLLAHTEPARDENGFTFADHKRFNAAVVHERDELRAKLGEAREQRPPTDTWQVSVCIPKTLSDDAKTSLFDAITEAAHDWQPEDRDGWDVDVTGHPTPPACPDVRAHHEPVEPRPTTERAQAAYDRAAELYPPHIAAAIRWSLGDGVMFDDAQAELIEEVLGAHTEPAEPPALVAEAIADGSHALALEDLRDDLALLRTRYDTATSLIDSLRGELTGLRRTVATALGVDTHLPTEELIERLQGRPVPSPEPRFTARLDDEGDWFVWDRDKARRDPRVLDRAEAEALARSLNGCPVPSPGTTSGVLAEIAQERARQDAKWGEQNHPDGTGQYPELIDADVARMACQGAAEGGYLDWLHILREEVAEAFAETHPGRLRAELIQVAAVAVNWVEAIDRREGSPGTTSEPDRLELLRMAAAGRREYANGIGEDDETNPGLREQRDMLLIEVSALDKAVKILEGDNTPLYGLLPSWRWTDDMSRALAPREPASDLDRGPDAPSCVGASQPTSNDEAGSIGTTSEPDRDGWFTPSEAWDALQKHTGAPSDMPVGEAIATLAWLHAEACWYRDEVKQLRAAAGVGASSAPGPVPSGLTDIANRVSDTTDVNSEPSGQPQPGDTVRDHILPACTCHQSVRDCPWHAEEAAEYARQLTEDAIAEKREYLAEKALRRNAQEVSR